MKQLCINYTPTDALHVAANLPASKSISNRALVVASLGNFVGMLQNLAICDDTKAVLDALSTNTHTPNIGAAGTAMRFLTAYYAQKEGVWELSGSERMHNRPIAVLVDALRAVGASISYAQKEGYPPLRIAGTELTGGEVYLNGGVSSQYISALLMVAPLMQQGLVLHLTGQVVSVPYIEMTLSLMHHFGVVSQVSRAAALDHAVGTEAQSNVGLTIRIAPQRYTPSALVVENDWSAASYWYAVVALHPNATIRMEQLQADSWQGDAQLVRLFEPLGVKTTFTGSGVELSKKSISLPTRYVCDLKNQPDLAQTLVVACLLLEVPFVFSGLGNLKIKETNRIDALITECAKLGYVLKETAPGVLAWEGEKLPVKQPITIDTYEDHRMAMAFAPAVLKLGSLRINNPQVVTKSYPQFWEEWGKFVAYE